jgi:DNA-binding transcriptional LysR family regulator
MQPLEALMNWDDLRILAAVRDSGTYTGAGRLLRMDETTVARRVARLEHAFGMKLFDAIDGLRVPTHACSSALTHVDAMAEHAAAIGHMKFSDSRSEFEGIPRLATTNALAEEVLAPRLPTLLHKHQRLTIHLLTSSANVNFPRWEADVAIRLKKPQRGNFTISRLAEIPLYFFEPVAPLRDGREPIVCAYPDDFDETSESRFLERMRLKSSARCVCANGRVVRHMIQSRTAVGILPAYLCSDLLADKNLRASQLKHPREVWLLVQNHLKRDPAARELITWIRQCL